MSHQVRNRRRLEPYRCHLLSLPKVSSIVTHPSKLALDNASNLLLGCNLTVTDTRYAVTAT